MRKSWLAVLTIILVVNSLVLSDGVGGQGGYKVSNATQTGISPLGLYQVGDIDVVSLSNGNLSLVVPVVGLKGRGIGVGLNLHYDSRLWRKVYFENNRQQPREAWALHHDGLEMLPAGWKTNIPRLVYNSGPTDNVWVYDGYTYIEDGVGHNFSQVRISYNINYGTNPPSPGINPVSGTEVRMGVATDGSYLRFELEKEVGGEKYFNVVTKPDGTMVVFGGRRGVPFYDNPLGSYPLMMIDRHGNRVVFKTYRGRVRGGIASIRGLGADVGGEVKVAGFGGSEDVVGRGKSGDVRDLVVGGGFIRGGKVLPSEANVYGEVNLLGGEGDDFIGIKRRVYANGSWGLWEDEDVNGREWLQGKAEKVEFQVWRHSYIEKPDGSGRWLVVNVTDNCNFSIDYGDSWVLSDGERGANNRVLSKVVDFRDWGRGSLRVVVPDNSSLNREIAIRVGDEVRVSPVSAHIVEGEQIQFRAEVYRNGVKMEDISNRAVWSISNGHYFTIDRGLVATREVVFPVETVSADVRAEFRGLAVRGGRVDVVADRRDRIEEIEDSLGRKIEFKYEYYPLKKSSASGEEYTIKELLLSKIRYIDSNGSVGEVKFYYQEYQLNWSWRDWGILDSNIVKRDKMLVLSELILPNGMSYLFGYDNSKNNGRGQLTGYRLPTGGSLEFTYGKMDLSSDPGNDDLQDVVTMRNKRAYGVLLGSWRYTYRRDGKYFWSEVVDPRGVKEVVKFDCSTAFHRDAQGRSQTYGEPLEVERITESGGRVLRRVSKEWDLEDIYPYEIAKGYPSDHRMSIATNPRVKVEERLVAGSNNNMYGSRVEYSYYRNYVIAGINLGYNVDGRPSETKEYQVEMDSGGNLIRKELKRRSEVDYIDDMFSANDSQYIGRNILGLVKSEKVYDGANRLESETYYFYDEGGLSGSPAKANYVNLGDVRRGNLTQVRYVNNSGEVVIRNKYDYFGNVVESRDGRNKVTVINYDPIYAAYVGEVRNPLGQSERFDYYYSTGLVKSRIDVNNRQTRYVYDVMGRLTREERPDGGLTVYEYVNEIPYRVIKRDYLDSSRYIETEMSYDYFGNLVKVVNRSDPQGAVNIDSEYDVFGRKVKVTNPYRNGDERAFTVYEYDELGRVVREVLPDGSEIKTEYNGWMTTVTDPVGRKKTVVNDALGNVVEVRE